MNQGLHNQVSLKSRLYGHLQLARISNTPTVLTNVLAGAALAGGVSAGFQNMDTSQILTLAYLMVAMALFYTSGMYFNDVLDYEIDLKERPERPLPSGLISRKTAAITAGLFLAAGLILLAFTGWEPFISGIVLAGLILLYDFWHKTNPYSHYIMALTRVMVYVTAFLAFPGEFSMEFFIIALLLFIYVSGLTFIAKSENKPDFSRYWPVICIVLPVLYFALRSDVVYLPVVLLFLGWSLYSLRFVYRSSNKDIGGGIVRLIAGLSLFDAMVLALYGITPAIAAAIILFILTRIFQGYIKGS